MATPHITGAVAVLRSINPDLTVEELESALSDGAKDIEAPGPDNDSGAGLLDLYVSAQIAIQGPGFPVVKILATQPTATEAGPVAGNFTLSRTGKTDKDLQVVYTVSGTAEAGSDYLPIAETMTIPAGATTVAIPNSEG
jgi:subtilisin family serine protease